jgi:hypothetical protein
MVTDMATVMVTVTDRVTGMATDTDITQMIKNHPAKTKPCFSGYLANLRRNKQNGQLSFDASERAGG